MAFHRFFANGVLRGPQRADIDGDGCSTSSIITTLRTRRRDTVTTAFTAMVALGDGISLGFEDPFALAI